MAAREEIRNHARKDIILTHEEDKHRFRKASDAQHKQKTEELNDKQTFPTTTTRAPQCKLPLPNLSSCVSPLRRAAMNTHHSSDRADCGVRAWSRENEEPQTRILASPPPYSSSSTGRRCVRSTAMTGKGTETEAWIVDVHTWVPQRFVAGLAFSCGAHGQG